LRVTAVSGLSSLALVESRRLRGPTMTGPALRRIGTVTPAQPDFQSGEAGGTVPAKVPVSRDLNHKTNVYCSR